MKFFHKIFAIIVLLLSAGCNDTVPQPVQTQTQTNTDVISDLDGDGIIDSQDPDIDGDGIFNNEDPYPYIKNTDTDTDTDTQTTVDPDLDNDGIIDSQDPDIDGDGILNEVDPFPYIKDDTPDTTTDSDNDGVADISDAFPNNPNETIDSDLDGVGNNEDLDDDNDGESDELEIANGTDPLDANDNSAEPVVGLGDIVRGQEIYFKANPTLSCATCHGDEGEGVEAFQTKALSECGARCVDEKTLTDYIAIAMPPSQGMLCEGQCAADVSAFILSEFTSELNCNAVEQEYAAPSRRLNKQEIINAVNDVFGAGGDVFEEKLLDAQETGLGGFTTVGSHSTIDYNFSNNFLDASITAVDQLFANKDIEFLCNVPAPTTDQCNTTPECKALFGDTADDCSNSASDMSICMCSGTRCDVTFPDILNTGNNMSSDDCFADVIKPLARKLHREEISDEYLEELRALSDDVALSLGQTDGHKAAVNALLVSPKFLLVTPNQLTTQTRALTQKELATRLALTLWVSLPDDELLESVERNFLLTQADIDEQISRMMFDEKFDRFKESFATQWLGLENLGYKVDVPSTGYTQEQWDEIRADLKTETVMFVSEVFEQNLTFKQMMQADFSFLNPRLAQFYGVPELVTHTDNNQFVKVNWANDSRRKGLLTQGSILVHSADVDVAPIAHRGVHILGGFSCDAPSAPDDPTINDQVMDQAAGDQSWKEKVADRKSKEACKHCHAQLDPIGWGFTEFDFIGRDALTDPDGDTLDPKGVLLGENFNNTSELIDLLVEHKTFDQCFSQKLVLYAVGRKVTRDKEDLCHAQSVVNEIKIDGNVKVLDMINAFIKNDVFTKTGTKVLSN